MRYVLGGVRTAERFCAATEVHTGKNTWPTRVLSAGDALTNSAKKDVPTEHGVVSAALTKVQREKAGAAAVRRGGSAAAPRGDNRRAGADDGLESFVLERTLHFDASADR